MIPGLQAIPPFLAGLESPRLLGSPVLLLSTQGSVSKIMELEILRGELGPKLLLGSDL